MNSSLNTLGPFIVTEPVEENESKAKPADEQAAKQTPMQAPQQIQKQQPTAKQTTTAQGRSKDTNKEHQHPKKRRMRVPLSTPAGTFTESFLLLLTRP